MTAQNALADLIERTLEASGENIQDVADRAGLARQTISNMLNRTGPRQLPRRQTLEALARGLECSLETVTAAAIETMTPNGHVRDHRLQVLVDQASQLSPADVDVLLATARALKTAQAERV